MIEQCDEIPIPNNSVKIKDLQVFYENNCAIIYRTNFLMFADLFINSTSTERKYFTRFSCFSMQIYSGTYSILDDYLFSANRIYANDLARPSTSKLNKFEVIVSCI